MHCFLKPSIAVSFCVFSTKFIVLPSEASEDSEASEI